MFWKKWGKKKKPVTCKQLGAVLYCAVANEPYIGNFVNLLCEDWEIDRDILHMEIVFLGSYAVHEFSQSQKLFGNKGKKIFEEYLEFMKAVFKDNKTPQSLISFIEKTLPTRLNEYEKILLIDDDTKLFKLGIAVLEHVNKEYTPAQVMLIVRHYIHLLELFIENYQLYEIID